MKEEPKFTFFKKSIITRLGDEKPQPYLIRWTLFSCPWFSIKIHKILMSDDDCMHDHPWNFVSFILWGGYWEERIDFAALGATPETPIFIDLATQWWKGAKTKKTWYGPGSILWREGPFKAIHRLDLEDKYLQGHVLKAPATTLVITFKRFREWGFYTKEGWIPWYKYTPQNRC